MVAKTRGMADDEEKEQKMRFERERIQLEQQLEDALRKLVSDGNAVALEVAAIADIIPGIPMACVAFQLIASVTTLLPPCVYNHMLTSLMGEKSSSSLFLLYAGKSGTGKNVVYDSVGPPVVRRIMALAYRAMFDPSDSEGGFADAFKHLAFDKKGMPISVLNSGNSVAMFEMLVEHPSLDKFHYGTPEAENFTSDQKAAADGRGSATERTKWVQVYDGNEWEKRNGKIVVRRPKISMGLCLFGQPVMGFHLYEVDLSGGRGGGGVGFFARFCIGAGNKDPFDYKQGVEVTVRELGKWMMKNGKSISNMERRSMITLCDSRRPNPRPLASRQVDGTPLDGAPLFDLTLSSMHVLVAAQFQPAFIARRVVTLRDHDANYSSPPVAAPAHADADTAPGVLSDRRSSLRASRKRPREVLDAAALLRGESLQEPTATQFGAPSAEEADAYGGQAHVDFTEEEGAGQWTDERHLHKYESERILFAPGSFRAPGSTQVIVSEVLQELEDLSASVDRTAYHKPSIIKQQTNLKRLLPGCQSIALGRQCEARARSYDLW